MRVLFVHNDYRGWSGEESAATALARLLADHGHEVAWFRRSSSEILGMTSGKMKAFFTGLHNPCAARALARYLDRNPVDLVQVQNLYPLLSPAILRPIKERGIPLVMRCPNYRLFCPNGRHWSKGGICEKCASFGGELWCILKNCEDSLPKSVGYALRNAWARKSRRILRNVDMFIVQTDFQKRKFMERGIPESRLGIVPGLVPHNAADGPHDRGKLVTFVGRISPEKGIEDFLAAARRMPEVSFAVAGHEDQNQALRRQAPSNVAWLGFLPPQEMPTLYARSRIIVVPSRWYEGFPNVLVHAMVYGCSVVATRIGAMTSIVDDRETGLLFRAGDPDDLVAQLRTLLNDRELWARVSKAGREKAATHYGPESVYAALMAAYTTAADLNRRRTKRYSPSEGAIP